MSPLRVLHIDDDPDILDIVSISLGIDPEITVRGCNSGADGLTAAAIWQPDLILLDVMMPVMDGPATLGHLQKNHRTAALRVVFITARAQTREVDYFKSLGAAGVISKPFDPINLAAALRCYMQQEKPDER